LLQVPSNDLYGYDGLHVMPSLSQDRSIDVSEK
jgi:hypothetical protein